MRILDAFFCVQDVKKFSAVISFCINIDLPLKRLNGSRISIIWKGINLNPVTCVNIILTQRIQTSDSDIAQRHSTSKSYSNKYFKNFLLYTFQEQKQIINFQSKLVIRPQNCSGQAQLFKINKNLAILSAGIFVLPQLFPVS